MILDIILWPVKFWYTTLLVILIADKIVAITPVPWDDLIVTAVKKVMDKIKNLIDNLIASIVVKPIESLFKKEEEKKENCCSDGDCDCK